MKRMVMIAALILFAAACPEKKVEIEKAEDATVQIEDGGGEDHVVMDALVIEG